MRLFLFIVFVLFSFSNLKAQIKLLNETIDGSTIYAVDYKLETKNNDSICFYPIGSMPEFPGGDTALTKFIHQNINYPDSAIKYCIQGTVRVYFGIEQDGSIVDVIVKNPLGCGLDDEAMAVIKLMPNWKPAIENGKAVKSNYIIPIKFVLPKEEGNAGAPTKPTK